MPYKDPEKKYRWEQKRNAQIKQIRALNIDPARWILHEARRADKRRGLICDLAREVVEKLIEPGCHYCSEKDLRMTLDRVDNSKGHSLDNVVPACIRCNYTRRHMPYSAWLFLVEGMRQAREAGAFGSWTGRTR